MFINKFTIVNYMQTELLQPQEIEVHYILPMIRKQLALALKDIGLSQKDIAAKLHIRESTISQYITDKRGSHIECDDALKQQIKASAQRLQTKNDLIRETQSLLRFIRHSNRLCQIHKQFANVPNGCMMAAMGCDKE